MPSIDPMQFFLICLGTVVMGVVLIRTITQSAVAVAFQVVEDRRAFEIKKRQDNAAAEALGREAALEPLALNPDGSIEEPVLGVAES